MTLLPIFQANVSASDVSYMNLRKSEKDSAKRARDLTEKLWGVFHPYADMHFLTEIRNSFDERFWEMYLVCTLLDKGFSLSCPKPGPDVLIELDNKRVWIEAIAPSPGAEASPDRVPGYDYGSFVAQKVPSEKIILRLRSAIEEKYINKYQQYYQKKIVAENDVFVIAINGCQLPHANADHYPPHIVRSVFPIGNEQLLIDKKSMKITDSGFEYRDNVKKNSGAVISTSVFFDDRYSKLSGIIYTRVDAGNPTPMMGQDFVFIHNPIATNPLPKGFFKFGEEYFAVDMMGDEFSIEMKNWEEGPTNQSSL